jgi:hypothetical protein
VRNIATFNARVQPELPQVVTSDSIHSGSAAENVTFVAMLFGSSVYVFRSYFCFCFYFGGGWTE